MFIEKIEVGGLYSFIQNQTIDELKKFNIIIGPNGSGKSSLLKVIDGQCFEQTSNIIKSDACNGISWTIEAPKNLCIQTKNNGIVRFEKQFEKPWQHKQGNVLDLRYAVKWIRLPCNEAFIEKAKYVSENQRGFVNFGLYFIFNALHTLSDNGFISHDPTNTLNYEQAHSVLRVGVGELESLCAVPSGVLNCAKLLLELATLESKETIVILDEPELSLEPRMVRRLFYFLVWFATNPNEFETIQEQNNYENVESQRRFNPNIYGITIHDKRIDFDDTELVKPLQWFIATHSPVFINSTLNLGKSAKLLACDLQIFDMDEQGPQNLVRTTSIRQPEDPRQTLDLLGVKGSDLLQTNGVIWVEGPSDIVYIQNWLRLYARENNCQLYVPGIHFEFQMYGGSLLANIGLDADDANESYNHLVSMFSFSRNTYVVTDSDAKIDESGEVVDKSNFAAHKNRIKDAVDFINNKGHTHVGMWYLKGNTKITTIEDYLDQDYNEVKGTKKQRAIKITEQWTDIKLAAFECGLEEQITSLYKTIEQWNTI